MKLRMSDHNSSRTEIVSEEAEQFSVQSGLFVPPALTTGAVSERAHASVSAHRAFLSIGISPVEAGETDGRDVSAESVAREEYNRLYRAGRLGECRRLSERMLETGADRVVWTYKLASVPYEQGNHREAYSILLTNAHLLAGCSDAYAAGNYNNTFGMVSQALGELHGMREYLDRALYCYREASRLYELAGLPLKSAYAENNTGWLLIAMGLPERAHKHLNKAQLLFNDAGEAARVADVEDTRALAFEAEGNLKEAFECSSRAVSSLLVFGEAEAKSLKQACETHRRIFEKLRGDAAAESLVAINRIEGKVEC